MLQFWPVCNDVHVQVTQNPNLERVAPHVKLGQPSQAAPMGKTVKVSINTLTSGKGLTKMSLL
jgi:hypothetical protein